MNMLDKYVSTANRYIEKIKLNKDVIGIMHLGGIARGYADEHSDIDLALFSMTPLNITLGEQLTEEGYDLEIFNVVINDSWVNWGPIQKEAYEEGYIIYDPTGKVSEFINKALNYDDHYRVSEMLRLIFKIAWHGWIYTPFRQKYIKGYHWILPEDLWFQRKKEYNAYYLTQICVYDYIELLYVINRKWTPDYKWRLVKSFNLPLLPKEYESKILYLINESWNEFTWNKKREVFQSLIDETISTIIQDMPDDWYGALSHE